jgi:glycosyltransferase involved in cell wall biosynthesis
MISVVIPAHNEERVIGRCLGAVAGQDVDVVVVCNGCSDATATIARSFGPSVRVETIPEASKSAALNRGDEFARYFPRIYLDADTVLRPDALDSMAAELISGRVLAVGATVEYDLSNSSRLVRSHYKIASRLPSVRDDIVGGGVYGLSATARSRFGRFPSIIGDDHFVRECFAPNERGVADGVSVVTAERRLVDLVQRKARVCVGNRQVYRAQRDGRLRALYRQAQWLGVVRREPRLLRHAPTYVTVTAAAKLLSRWRQWRGTHLEWSRDDESRAASNC